MIISKYLETKEKQQLKNFFISQMDGVILYSKPPKMNNLRDSWYRVQECEN